MNTQLQFHEPYLGVLLKQTVLERQFPVVHTPIIRNERQSQLIYHVNTIANNILSACKDAVKTNSFSGLTPETLRERILIEMKGVHVHPLNFSIPKIQLSLLMFFKYGVLKNKYIGACVENLKENIQFITSDEEYERHLEELFCRKWKIPSHDKKARDSISEYRSESFLITIWEILGEMPCMNFENYKTVQPLSPDNHKEAPATILLSKEQPFLKRKREFDVLKTAEAEQLKIVKVYPKKSNLSSHEFIENNTKAWSTGENTKLISYLVLSCEQKTRD